MEISLPEIATPLLFSCTRSARAPSILFSWKKLPWNLYSKGSGWSVAAAGSVVPVAPVAVAPVAAEGADAEALAAVALPEAGGVLADALDDDPPAMEAPVPEPGGGAAELEAFL